MEILLSEIPEEGLFREGTFPASIFGLADDDSIRPTGPVAYRVTLYRFDDVVVFSGELRGEFELQCATCLEFFPFPADYPDWNSDLDLEEGQRAFDLQQIVRDDLLLLLPASPQCDELIPDRVCPKAHLLAEAEDRREREAETEGGSEVWKGLDDWGRTQ